ncbi:MAG: helix-turn-helix domain-containing protein [Rhodospirillaceae bacterium]|jgi:predicted DNA-binding transcriptional regulator AlpA|nr:helix-turn-helix domain-containing protein [Rhodospirillaceae bacterium]
MIDAPLMDENAVAEMLGVSCSKLQKLRLTGDGPPFVKIGRHVRYRPKALDQYIEEHTRKSTCEQRRS